MLYVDNMVWACFGSYQKLFGHCTLLESVMDAFNLPCYLFARDNIHMHTCLNDEAVLEIKQSEDILISLVNLYWFTGMKASPTQY